jgi:LPS-assembly protein
MSAQLLGVSRGQDQLQGSPTFITGYQEGKVHAAFQAAWQKQWIAPGGVVATPYLGLRGDAAYYDGSSPLLPGPTSLFNAAPIAAIDIRYPWIATIGSSTHVIEPIVQLAYTGSTTSLVGITNDDAQSFVFDDTNLFSYNRFSGADRLETGLRANVGGHYQANFADGNWFNLLAGQSFHLAGTNAFDVADPAQTGTGSGLAPDASYMVLGANGSVFGGLELGAKLLLDPATMRVARSGVGTNVSYYGYTAGVDYLFIAADAARGTTQDQQEIAGRIGIPFADYWRVSAHASWDLAASSYLEYGAGIQYDDGFLLVGADARRTGPTNTTPNDTQFTATFKLKGPAGSNFGY